MMLKHLVNIVKARIQLMQASSNPFILKMRSPSHLSLCLKSVQANKTETWPKCFAEQRTVLKNKELLNVVLVKSRTALW